MTIVVSSLTAWIGVVSINCKIFILTAVVSKNCKLWKDWKRKHKQVEVSRGKEKGLEGSLLGQM